MKELPPLTLRVDWDRLITDIMAAGYTSREIEYFTRIPRSTFNQWRQNWFEPNHMRGECMISFWCQVMDAGRDDVPMTDVPPSAARVKWEAEKASSPAAYTPHVELSRHLFPPKQEKRDGKDDRQDGRDLDARGNRRR